MVDGWAGVAGEILRLKPLIMYHLKNTFLVKTEKDRDEAMDPGTIGFNTGEPQIQLYFLLGLVYAVVTPVLLPFIIVFFGFAYVVYRHQIINVYNQEYESAAAFWPDVHGRIIAALVVSQLLLMGLLSTKKAAQSTPLLITLPILTIWFHLFCKGRYEPAFVRYPLQEAVKKDTLERTREPNLNLKGFLQNAYIHPVFKSADESDGEEMNIEGSILEPDLVQTKRHSRRNTPAPSKQEEVMMMHAGFERHSILTPVLPRSNSGIRVASHILSLLCYWLLQKVMNEMCAEDDDGGGDDFTIMLMKNASILSDQRLTREGISEIQVVINFYHHFTLQNDISRRPILYRKLDFNSEVSVKGKYSEMLATTCAEVRRQDLEIHVDTVQVVEYECDYGSTHSTNRRNYTKFPGWICEERVMRGGRLRNVTAQLYYDPTGKMYRTKEVVEEAEKIGIVDVILSF
ncbi:hypothetical protein ACFE04_018639 [Oxalis oulophora]